MDTSPTIMPRIGDLAPDFEAVTTTGKTAFFRLQQRKLGCPVFTSGRFYTGLYHGNDWVCIRKSIFRSA